MAAFVTFIYQEFYTTLHDDHHDNGVASTTGSISLCIFYDNNGNDEMHVSHHYTDVCTFVFSLLLANTHYLR